MNSMRSQMTGEEKDSAQQAAVRHIEEPREISLARESRPPRSGTGLIVFATIMAAFWAGAAIAYLWGYFAGQGLFRLDPQLLAFAAAVTFLPPLLFIAAATALARALTLADTARELALVSDRLTDVDESAVQSAQRLGRAVRRELDALSSGLDGAFGRFRALETALEDRVAQLEDASARAGVKADNIAQRLRAEREGIEELATRLDEASVRAAELLAGKSAQLQAMIEAAGGGLKAAGQTLDAQVDQFRDAADRAANAPQAAAIELDRQAKSILQAGEAAASRAEFILARQERQRIAMNELLTRLKEEADAFQGVLEAQRGAVEKAAAVLAGEAKRLDDIADHGLRRIDDAMTSAAARSAQLAGSFTSDAERIKQTADSAEAGIAHLTVALREAAMTAKAAISSSTEDAKRQSLALVSEVAAQCNQMVEAAMAGAAARSAELGAGFARDAEGIKGTADAAEAGIARLAESLREATKGAETAIASSTENAKRRSLELVSDVTAECSRLVDAAIAGGAARSAQLASDVTRESDRVMETADAVEARIARLTEMLKETAAATQASIGESTEQTKRRSLELVNEVMAECNKMVESAITGAAARSSHLVSGFTRDVERVKETSDSAEAGIVKLTQSLREAAASAQALIADSTAEAKRRSLEMVGEAMAQCDHLLRAAGSVAEEAEKARNSLSRAAEEAERHILALPGIAAQEAQRVRETVRTETEHVLDISARAITTLQNRARRRPGEDEPRTQETPSSAAEGVSEGLRGLARRITGPKRRSEERGSERTTGNYDLSAVLAAADSSNAKFGRKAGNTAAFAALQASLADLAGDLGELAGKTADPAMWRRYLEGDRAVFARSLAAAIGPESVDRIAALYRDDPKFHESADAYLAEFEAMLGRAKDSDRDGFFASTLLTADTGKIYLTIAYALGRLE